MAKCNHDSQTWERKQHNDGEWEKRVETERRITSQNEVVNKLDVQGGTCPASSLDAKNKIQEMQDSNTKRTLTQYSIRNLSRYVGIGIFNRKF